MGPGGRIVQNQSDLLGAPDWDAMAAASRSRRRDQFEQQSLYASGGGSRVQELLDPEYRVGDLPGSQLAPIPVQGPALAMNDSAVRQFADPFLSQASASG